MAQEEGHAIDGTDPQSRSSRARNRELFPNDAKTTFEHVNRAPGVDSNPFSSALAATNSNSSSNIFRSLDKPATYEVKVRQPDLRNFP